MHIRKDANLALFLRTVNTCAGEVLFCTQEQDQLNLKSVLSQFIFATLTKEPSILFGGTIVCKQSRDLAVLEDFLTEK